MNENLKNPSEEKFEKFVVMLIASVAILVAVTAFLQNYASNLSDEANRTAQKYAIDSTTKEIGGTIQYSFDWQGAFQTWNEVDMQRVAATQSDNTTLADRYGKLEKHLVPLTPLLSKPYFDESSNWPNTTKYAADLYVVEATRLSELYEAYSELGRAWNDTADAFVIQITLLTVALSLYGLSLTLNGRVRWLFILVGSGLVAFCMGWMALELIVPRPIVSEDAIKAYTEGYGLSYQGKYQDAITSYDQALGIKPDYANAFYERGSAYLALDDYDHAISDYLSARDLGLDSINTQWNLGWTYYLQGDFDKAIATNETIIASNPTVIGMRMNQALTYLVQGNFDEAQRQYDVLVNEVQREIADAHANNQEPSASLWYYMDAASLDLQNLVDKLDGDTKSWTQAPEADLITADHGTIKQIARKEIARLKETTLALEYTGKLPPTAEVMKVSPFAFGDITLGSDGYVSDFKEHKDAVFAFETPAVTIRFVYDGPLPKEQLLWKFYLNGSEYSSFRSLWDTDLSGSDTWYKTVGFNYTNVFILPAGEYTVELYADYHLVQTGKFYVR